MIPVFRSLNEDRGRDVLFVSLYDLPARRKKLGWTIPDSGEMPLEILDDKNWKLKAEKYLSERPGLHIVNGIYHNQRIRHVADRLGRGGYRFGVIMEAPANLEMGAKRVLKSLLAPIITPLRTRPMARKAEFVLSASGVRQQAFEDLGFAPDRIFPFGYFPNFPLLERSEESTTPVLRVLCVGYLEPFKGQDCLLKALALLRSRSVPVECVITGFGSAGGTLKMLSTKLGLTDCVEFAGVVDNERLLDLFRWSNVLVAPGLEEPWGIRINEGLLSGLPVVVSDGIGANELIETSGAGLIFRAGSEVSLADSLDALFRRLQDGDGLTRLVHEFRESITPEAAAVYLEKILDYCEGMSRGQSTNTGRPVPPWLCPLNNNSAITP
jgi:glycosyltransferase involved in cell wall biosynthesis